MQFARFIEKLDGIVVVILSDALDVLAIRSGDGHSLEAFGDALTGKQDGFLQLREIVFLSGIGQVGAEKAAFPADGVAIRAASFAVEKVAAGFRVALDTGIDCGRGEGTTRRQPRPASSRTVHL